MLNQLRETEDGIQQLRQALAPNRGGANATTVDPAWANSFHSGVRRAARRFISGLPGAGDAADDTSELLVACVSTLLAIQTCAESPDLSQAEIYEVLDKVLARCVPAGGAFTADPESQRLLVELKEAMSDVKASCVAPRAAAAAAAAARAEASGSASAQTLAQNDAQNGAEKALSSA